MVLGADPIADLAGVLNECESRSELEAARLEWLERAVGFDASYFGAASPQQRRAPAFSGVDSERVSRCEANADRYWQDRMTLQRAALFEGGVVADHDALSARARDRMPFYREVVAGHGIRATAVAILRQRGQVSGSVFLGRSSRGARFGGELGLLKRALPVLTLAEAVHIAGDLSSVADHSFGLTPREQTVLRLLCRGWTNAQIAAQLGSSPRTVKNQVSAILRKTKTTNRTQLAARRPFGKNDLDGP
jgi:DNA-binding CsgD family transcriptional regulator